MKRKTLMVLLTLSFILISMVVQGQVEPPADHAYDFEGETLKIQFPATHTPFGRDYNWYDQDPRLAEHVESVEEMFNVNIEFVADGGFTQAMELVREGVMAGDQPVHVLYTAVQMTELAADGLLYPLDDVLEEDFYDSYPEPWANQDWDEIYSFGPHTYGFEGRHNLFAITGITWNKRLFEEEGLPDLYELYDEGEWTWDKFLEIAKEATRDTTGDGEIDQFGLSNSFSEAALAASNDARLSSVENGEVKFELVQPEVLEVFEFMKEIEEAEISMGWTSWRLPESGWAMQMTNINLFQSGGIRADIEDYDLELGLMPLPKGPNATDYVGRHNGAWHANIPIYVEEPRAVIEVVCALMKLREPYVDVEEKEQQFVDDYAMYVHDLKTLEIWEYLHNNASVPRTFFDEYILNQVGYNDVIEEIIEEGADPASALEAIQPQANQLLEDLFQ